MELSLSSHQRGPASAGARIAVVGTLPPTKCGIATFTDSLARSIRHAGVEVGIVRLVEPGDEPSSSPDVITEWHVGDAESRQAAIDAVSGFDAVVVQHEYGIYRGADGDEVVDFLRRVTPPTMVVLHTVLTNPSCHQRQVLEQVISVADSIVVQSDAARRRLDRYDIERPEQVVVIPHGAWTTPEGTRSLRSERPIVLTWGHLGPGKGLEHAIDAIARLRDLDPPVLYVIAGETHPKVRSRDGEAYREGLMRAAARLGNSVVFDRGYRDDEQLAALVRSADVVLLPYDSKDQVTSGVLVEALAAGRPVVATAFPHAVEALAGGAGVVVRHGDSAAMARSLRQILTNPDVAKRMRLAARKHGATLAWDVIGHRYVDALSALSRQRAVV